MDCMDQAASRFARARLPDAVPTELAPGACERNTRSVHPDEREQRAKPRRVPHRPSRPTQADESKARSAELDGALVDRLDRAPGALGPIWDDASDCLFVLAAGGKVLWLNRAARHRWTGLNGVACLGRPFQNLWDEASRSGAAKAIQAARIGRPSSFRGTLRASAEPESIWDVQVSATETSEPEEPFLLVVARDVTESLQIQTTLDRAARVDGMTGLLNRSGFVAQVDAHLSQRCRVTLVLLDLDHLKRANDTDGHMAGDDLIKHFAARLERAQDGQAVVARLGGDEFALACFGDADVVQLTAVVEDLCRPTILASLTLPYSVSAGLATLPASTASFDELYLCADMALYACKARGGGHCRVFDASLREQLQTSASLTRLVRRALRTGDIFPHYQPKVDLATGDVVGFEALMRVRFPDGTIQTAGSVAEVLRQADLAVAIDEVMFRAVLTDVRMWRMLGVIRPVAVNVSDAAVQRAGFASRVLSVISSAGLEPSLIEVEITETVLLDGADSCVEANLGALAAAGVRVTLDDFGTGYASLSHLKRFPISTVKIDKQFVDGLPGDPGDLAIINAMIGLANSLSLGVVAEGVEHVDQLDLLRSMGCRMCQGFLFAPAVSADEAFRMAKAGLSSSPARAADHPALSLNS